MAQLENVRANTASADPERLGGTMKVNRSKRRRSELDEEAKKKLHAKLMGWYVAERDKQGENRFQMATDENFYDGIQWSDEDAAALMERGQAPLVFNQIKPTINWLLGTERRTKIEGKILPREEDDEQGAEVKTKMLKYLSDVNRTPFVRSQAFKSQVIAGVGWMEDAIDRDPENELLSTRYVDWKNIYHDSTAKEPDLSDGRYLFRFSYLDLDVAETLFPDRLNIIRSAAVDEQSLELDEDSVWYMGSRVGGSTSGDWSMPSRRSTSSVDANARDRVKVIEAWYRTPVSCVVCRAHDEEGREFDGQEFDPKNDAHAWALQEEHISTHRHVKMVMRVALMTESHLLYEGKSPYKHNRFPFTPAWCYRRHRDGLPYGVIRDIRDAQVDYNKRASKALYILSTVRVVMDKGAVDDVEELRREVALPNGVIEKNANKKLEITQDKALADQHLKLMVFDGQMIRDVGGVTDQNLGNAEGAMSGRAIGKLQDQGSIVTAALFDNFRLAIQMQGEIQLSLMEQFYTEERVVRIVGENRPIEWLRVNQYDEASGKYLNDITRRQADYIVGEQDFQKSTREAMFEAMMDLVGKLQPEVGLALLDMVIDFADVPNKDELVARIRKLNGQRDPSKKPTPEEEQALAAAEQEQQAAKALQMEMVAAELAETKARAELAQANAAKSAAQVGEIMARIDKIVADAVNTGVTAAYQAMQAAQVVATVPGVTPIADAIMAGAGYQDANGQAPNIPAPAIAPAAPIVDQQQMMAQNPVAPETIAPAQQEFPELQQADGAASGIETMGADGVDPSLSQP